MVLYNYLFLETASSSLGFVGVIIMLCGMFLGCACVLRALNIYTGRPSPVRYASIGTAQSSPHTTAR